jgi:hypothetical protein
MVAELTCKSRSFTDGCRSRWPCRSIELIRIGIDALRRFPHSRSLASHRTMRACFTASSYRRFRAALGGAEAITIAGVELLHRIRVRGRSTPEIWNAVLAA